MKVWWKGRTGTTVLLVLAVWNKKYPLQGQSHWSRSLEQLLFLSLEPIWVPRLGFEHGGLVVNLGKSVHTQIAPFVQRFMWGWKKEGKRTTSPTMVISHKTSSVPLLCLQQSPELCCFQLHANVKKLTCSQCQLHTQSSAYEVANLWTNINNNYQIRG